MPARAPLLHSDRGVTILGGGVLSDGDLPLALARAPRLVAADGGAAAALAAGQVPEAVIGDMDSLDAATRAALDPATLHEIAEQATTDFDKALRSVVAPFVLAVGFTGDRVDHELAVYHVLAARRTARCVVIGARDAVCHLPPRLALALPEGVRLSLFPLAPVTVTARGLAWPLDALALDPLGRIGTSNRTAAGRQEIAVSGPGALLIVPRAGLDAVLAALTDPGTPGWG